MKRVKSQVLEEEGGNGKERTNGGAPLKRKEWRLHYLGEWEEEMGEILVESE